MPLARLGASNRQLPNASNGFVSNRFKGLADTRKPRDPNLSSSDCHRRPNPLPEHQHDCTEEGYLQVTDSTLPPPSNVAKILAYLPSPLRSSTSTTSARLASVNRDELLTTA